MTDTASRESAEAIRLRTGWGDWEAFNKSGLAIDDVLEAARDWRQALDGVARPWLCWNVNEDWSLVQQRMVTSVGWTPVVGFDPRVGPPRVISEAILVDFNKRLGLPTMLPHFPLEFVFAFTEKLAFWHADLLLRKDQMGSYAESFASLPGGAMAAVGPPSGPAGLLSKAGLRALLFPKKGRYWELLGCTTREASQHNFDVGCGWWINFFKHPNCPSEEERKIRSGHYWDSGCGIWYWKHKYNRTIHSIREKDIDQGHFTRINNPQYIEVTPNDWRRELSKDLVANFNIRTACEKMGLQEFLG